MPVGHIAAELWVGARLSMRTRSRIVFPVAAVGLLPYLGYVTAPGLGVTLLLLLLAGAGSAYVLGLDQWFVATVPEELRGRAMTLMTAGLMTVQGAGMALAGLAAEFWPVHHVVTGAGVLGSLVCVLLVLEAHRAGARPTELRDGGGHDVTAR